MRAFGGRPGRGGGVVLRMSGMSAAERGGEGVDIAVDVAVTLLLLSPWAEWSVKDVSETILSHA